MGHSKDTREGMLIGENCNECGSYLDDGEGFPVTCDTCENGPSDEENWRSLEQ